MAAAPKLLLRCPRMYNGNLQLVRTYTSVNNGASRKLWTIGVLSGATAVGGGSFLLLYNKKVTGSRSDVASLISNVKHRPTPMLWEPTQQHRKVACKSTAATSGSTTSVGRFAIGQIVQAREGKDNKPEEYPLTAREERFNSFASLKYDGQIYMTMQDFLESIVDEDPRPRIGRFLLSKAQVDKKLANTPSRRRKTKYLFRDIMDQGILSYTEYLFLLCILTKPKAGYEIAFKMFDRDGNKRIDRREFLLMEEIFRKKSLSRKGGDEDDSVSLLSKFYDVPDSIWNSEELHIQETTLLRYFFGSKGKDTLDYDTFASFMDNLQSEVLELEFQEQSKGMPTISEVEFAKAIFKYTNLDDEEIEDYLDMVRERTQEEKGITFEQFKDFFQFVNNLDDFEIVLRMYSFADQPMSEDEFRRAVLVTTGHQLADHVVHTVFQIFDQDGDGKLLQREFMGAMKNRAHRGFREHLKQPVGWAGFKTCVKHELKQSQ
ncbi:calcium uptake protein 3, mitochondrial-like isoform X3 [Apostichopus japonicus]|uniref:calcium uptake protein 3, mitochondrial-like isoform X3 n=1 Tax=Stichopus japonicus TaxID=307972 RepID=UPI003AB2F39C